MIPTILELMDNDSWMTCEEIALRLPPDRQLSWQKSITIWTLCEAETAGLVEKRPASRDELTECFSVWRKL